MAQRAVSEQGAGKFQLIKTPTPHGFESLIEAGSPRAGNNIWTFGKVSKCQFQSAGGSKWVFAGRASFPTCTKKPERMAPVGDWDVTLVQRSAARGL